MRTGAIFARGSCRALKWMALVGMVFALGVGSAAAQQTLSGGQVEIDVADSMEGDSTTITVTVSAEIESAAAGAGSETTVTVTVSAAALDASTDAAALLALGGRVTPAEFNTAGQPDDFALGTGASVALTFVFPEEERTPTGRSFTHELTPKTVELQTRNHDDDAEDEGLRVTATPAGLTGASADTDDVKITDKDTQRYVLALDPRNQDLEEGDDVTVSLKADPPHVQASETLTLNIDKAAPDYSFTITSTDTNAAGAISNNRVTIGNAATTDQIATATITLDTPPNDRNRVLDTVTMAAYSGQAGAGTKESELAIPLKDGNVLPGITAAVTNADGDAVEDGMLMEGMTYTLTFTAVDDDGDAVEAVEDLMVALTGGGSADPRDDYSLAMSSIAIAEGDESSAAVNLEVDLDDDIGEDTLTFMATVTGESANGTEPSDAGTVLSLTIVDGTAKLVEAKPRDDVYQVIMDATAMAGDDGVNPGESIEIPLDDMFQVAPGYNLSFGFNMEGSDVAATAATLAGSNLNVNALEPGQAKFTVTATANAMGSSVEILDQTTPNVAQVLFPIDVVLKPFADTMISAEPMTIEEGENSTITATLSRMVHADDDPVVISLTASGGSLSADSIEIAAGMQSGTAMLMTEADDDYEGGTITVVASGTGIDGNASVVITLTDSDEPPVDESTVKAKADPQSVFDANVGSDFVKGGDAVSFDAGVLFEEFGADVDPLFGVKSSDDMVVGAVISGYTLTLTPVGYGSATVEVTVTDRASGDIATASGDVMVGLADVSVMVAAAAMMIDEGGSTMITATASRMLEGDEMAMVNLTVVGDGTLDADSITIAAGSDSGSVTLTATEDDDDYEDETVTVIASGTGIDGNMSIEIAVTDNDTAPEPPVVEPTVTAKDNAAQMIADAIATAAGGGAWMVGGMAATVDMSMLFDVDDGVTAAYSGVSSDDAVVRALSSGMTLTLTPMGAGTATITVTGSDAASGSVASASHDAAVVLQTLSVTVTPSATAVDEGGMVTLTAGANRAVTEATTIALTLTGDTAAVTVEPAAITIAAGSDSGTAIVTAVEDADAADANVAIVATGPGMAPTTINIAITDNDPTVSSKSQAEVTAAFMTAIAMASGADGWLPGGDAATVDMTGLFTTNGSPTLEYTAMSSAEDMVGASASGSTLTLTAVETGDATITVTATDTSGDAADTATVSAMVTVGVIPLEIMVSPTTAEVTEGGTVEITATANKMVDANVEVMLVRDAASSAGEDDYSLMPVLITIMAGEATGMATLTATDDVTDEPAESLTLVARVKDHGDVGTVMVSIMDNDEVSALTLSGPMDTNLIEGEEYELTVTADPAVQVDTEVAIMRDRGASDADDADFTVGSVMLSAGDATGTTMLMVTDDGMDDSGHGMPEALVLYGMANGEPTNSLTFNIWDAAVPALPVIAQLLLAAFLAFGGYRRYRRR